MGRLKRKKPIVSRGPKGGQEGKGLIAGDTAGNQTGETEDLLPKTGGGGGKKAEQSRKVQKRTTEQVAAVKQPAFWVKTRQFFQEVKIELKKVTWPNRKETTASTLVVIILTIIISLFLGIVDFGLSSIVGVVLR